MLRSSYIALLILTSALAGACENGAPWSSAPSETIETRHDFGPTATYGRRLIFMGPGDQLPTAAIFDFTSLSDSVAVRRGVRARVLTDEEWTTVLDAGWTLEPMREPWRIVPGGGLRIVVNDAGELSALDYPGDPAVRLQPGALLAESSPDAGTQFVLRQATLTVGDETVRGILLDSQLGRAVSPSAVPRVEPESESEPEPESEEEEGDEAAADGAPPTPIARPGAEAFLVNNSGYYVVFASSAGGQVAWISHSEGDDIQRGATLEPTAWSEPEAPAEDGESDAVSMPTQWRVAGAGSLTGELTATATDAVPLTGLDPLSGLGYVLVTGWIAEDGVRRDVFGLLRQVR